MYQSGYVTSKLLENGRENLTQLLRTLSPATKGRLPQGVQSLPLPGLLGTRELGGGTLEVGSCCISVNIMTLMKFDQLRQHRWGTLAGRMMKSCRASHHLERNPGEPPGHPNANVSGISALVGPFRRQDAEVVVAPTQGAGGQEQHLAEPAIAAAGQ